MTEGKPKVTNYAKRGATLFEDGKAVGWRPYGFMAEKRDSQGKLERHYCPGATADSKTAKRFRAEGFRIIDGKDGKPTAGHVVVEVLAWIGLGGLALLVAFGLAWLWEALP